MKRRMIAQDIISEGRFLRMSLTAQALYMHLVANADDDGCVDAYTVTRMIGAKEDDLVLLKEREYITVLDEREYILWITGWQDFNWIEPRYKEDSKWLPLLRSKVEGLEIVESSKTDYNKRRYAKRKLEKQIFGEGATQEVHSVHTVQTTGGTPPSIGKDSIDKNIPPSLRLGVEGVGDIPMSKETRDIWDYWEETMAPITRNKTFQRNALVGLIRNHGMDDVKKMIRVAAAALSAEYVPAKFKADSPKQLEERWDSLVLWARSEGSKQHKKSQIHSTVVR